MKKVLTVLCLLLFTSTAFAEAPTQKTNYTPQSGERFVHYCSKTKESGPELVCMKNLLTFIYRNERAPELEYEYKRVYKESKLNVLTTRVERTLTLTIDKSLIEKDKQEIKNYQNSKVAKS